MANEKTKFNSIADFPDVTLIQSKDGQVRKVRISGTELRVLNASPTMMNGQMAMSLVIATGSINGEKAVEEEQTA